MQHRISAVCSKYVATQQQRRRHAEACCPTPPFTLLVYPFAPNKPYTVSRCVGDSSSLTTSLHTSFTRSSCYYRFYYSPFSFLPSTADVCTSASLVYFKDVELHLHCQRTAPDRLSWFAADMVHTRCRLVSVRSTCANKSCYGLYTSTYGLTPPLCSACLTTTFFFCCLTPLLPAPTKSQRLQFHPTYTASPHPFPLSPVLRAAVFFPP
jgi:hypothetical protein